MIFNGTGNRKRLTFSKLALAVFLIAALAAPSWAVEVDTYAELMDALSGTENIIEVTADIDVEKSIAIDRSVTLKGNGHTLKPANENEFPIISIESGSGPIDVTVDEFTLTGGKDRGMYIYAKNENINATVTNCTFTGNTAEQGAGMFAYSYGSPNEVALTLTLTNCTFTDNTANDDSGSGMGGGMAIGSREGGIAKATLVNCTFTGNTATVDEANGVYAMGGGMYVWGATANLVNCTFTGNEATGDHGTGGGMSVVMGQGDQATANLVNCTFADNRASYGPEVLINGAKDDEGESYIATLNAANTVFWNSGKAIALYGLEITYDGEDYSQKYNSDMTVLNLYNCAYGADAIVGLEAGEQGFTENENAKANTKEQCVEDLDWTGRTSKDVEVTVDGVKMKHTVFPLTAADVDTLIDAGLAKDTVVKSLGLMGDTETLVKNALATDQLGGERDDVPDIGAVECRVAAGVSLNETSQEITVGETLTLTATVGPDSATDKSVTWSTSNEAVVSVDQTGVVTGVAGGTATITVASSADKTVSADCVVTVKGTPKVTKTPEEKTGLIYKGTAQELISKGETDHGTLMYKLDTTNYSTDIPTGKNAGEYTVYYKVVGGANYVDVTPENNSLKVTISKANATVTAEDKSKTSGEADPALTATVTGLVKGDSINYTLSREAGEAVGTYTITPNGEETQGNYTVTFVNGKLTIKSKPEEQKAVEEAVKTIEQNPALNGTPAGNALKDALTTGTPEKQAAAADVVEILDKSYTEEELKELDLSEDDVKKIIENKEQEARDLKDEASGEVKDPTVPAATDLLAKSDNEDLQAAGKGLSVQPKVVTPEVLSETSRDQAVENIDKAAKNNDVPEGVDLEAVKAAAQPEALKTSNDITIEPASKNLEAQAKVVEKVFNEVSGDLASANGGKGLVIATVLPRMTPKVSGFFPLKVNLRHLLPDPRRRLCFWPSAAHFRQASGSVSVSVASGQDGDFFFLDENGVPTAVVSGDASKMTAVAFLTAGAPYEDAFITVDATEKDQETLTDLKEKANPNGGENTPTSNKGSGGCDAGLGLGGIALLCTLPAVMTRKRR